jgi:hypothetical protein
MQTNLLNEILAFLLGRKYYANVISVIGTDKNEICSYIFSTPEEAEAHRRVIGTTVSFNFVTTISFRSRKINL